jgi:putative Mn2+ efflux pump MntP
MRALCGAIITAGALIGLGLTAVGVGLRFQGVDVTLINENTEQLYGASSLMIALVTLLLALIVGLGVTFLGLAFHHHRRYHELLLKHPGGSDRPTVAA